MVKLIIDLKKTETVEYIWVILINPRTHKRVSVIDTVPLTSHIVGKTLYMTVLFKH